MSTRIAARAIALVPRSSSLFARAYWLRRSSGPELGQTRQVNQAVLVLLQIRDYLHMTWLEIGGWRVGVNAVWVRFRIGSGTGRRNCLAGTLLRSGAWRSEMLWRQRWLADAMRTIGWAFSASFGEGTDLLEELQMSAVRERQPILGTGVREGGEQ